VTDRLVSRVADYCVRHGLLPAGPVLAMVSGGADSMCLLHVLAEIHSHPVGVLTIDHGLRTESAAEVAAVAKAAEDLGCEAHVARLELAGGSSLQERARNARREAAQAVAAEGGYAAIATGHTASDQAETVLFRLARGTGRTGARGMAPSTGKVVRPLLAVARAETRAWCRDRGIAFIDDPSNADLVFARARVRHDLLPALEAIHPDAERHVAAFADRMRDEASLLDELVDAAWDRCVDGPGLSLEPFLAEVAPLRVLLVRRLIDRAGLPGEAQTSRAVERIAGCAEHGRRVEVPGGVALVERGVLLVERPALPAPPAATLTGPGVVPFGSVLVRAATGVAGTPHATCVPITGRFPLTVRPPQTGDRVALAGGGHQSVGRLLASAGVPARRRPQVPVVAAGDRLVWVAGHRADPRQLAEPGAPATILTMENV
jgi:tRNA(Ile)-lysidine synthase